MAREVKSDCCNAEVDFRGGGYDGEEIIPVYQVCKECGHKCEVKRLKGQCMDCDEAISEDDDNVCWNICNSCRNSVT